MANGNLKLAIQKKGRLSDKSLRLLQTCGLEVENFNERLLVSIRNFKLDILFLRDDDIPVYVQDNVADLGIVGENVILEKEADVIVSKALGFGKCRLRIGIPEEDMLDNIEGLQNKIIATSYPVILRKFLDEHGIKAKIIQISGSVEIAPSLGIADYICDLVSTGATLKLNHLKKSFPILDSEAVLIKNKSLENDPQKKLLFENLLTRIESVLNAKNSKYIMMNAPYGSIEEITNILPSLKSPTVLSLAEKSMVAIHAVIPQDQFWEINNDLKKAGASGILLLPIENMVL